MSAKSTSNSAFDELRSSSSDLIEQMKTNMQAASAGRISESKARYQTWNVRKVEPIVQAQSWSNAITLNKEYMDPRQWSSEMRDACAKTEAMIDTAVCADAAGVKPTAKYHAPAFFAWTLSPEEQEAKMKAAAAEELAASVEGEQPQMSSANADTEWTREGNGWKSADGIFYSDADLIADVLGKATDGVMNDIEDFEDNEVESESTEDSDDPKTTSEHRLQFKWRPTEAPKRAKSHANAMQPANPNESVAHWTTEYDSTSAKIFAEHTEGPIAGVPTQTRAPIPLNFSWKRNKATAANADTNDKENIAEDASVANSTLYVGKGAAPYDCDPNPSAVEWNTEYNGQFDVKLPNNILHAQCALSEGAPYGTYKVNLNAWVSEYDSKYVIGGKVPALEKVNPYSNSPHPSDGESDGTESESVDLDQTFTEEGFDQEDLEKKLSPKRNKNRANKPLRFTSENHARFAWPTSGSPAKGDSCKPLKTTKIHHTDSEFEKSEAPLRSPEVVNAEKTRLVSENQMKFSIPELEEQDKVAPEPRGNKGNFSDPALLAHIVQDVRTVYSEAEEDQDQDHEGLNYDSLEVGSFDRDAGDTISSGDRIDADLDLERAEEEEGDIFAHMQEYVHSEHLTVTAPTPPTAPATEEKKKLVVRGKIVRLRKPVGASALVAKQKAVRATKASKTSNVQNKSNSTKGPNPVLKNARFPGGSDKQNGRFKSESSSQFVWRKQPLNL